MPTARWIWEGPRPECPGAPPGLSVTCCRAAPRSQQPSRQVLASFKTACLLNMRNVLAFSYPKFCPLFTSIVVWGACSAYLILSVLDWKCNHEAGLAVLRNSCHLSHSYVTALKLCLVVCCLGFYPSQTGGLAEQR